jgi:hypothetical protein
MSGNGAVALWKASTAIVVADSVSDVPTIVGAAKQLRVKEQQQIAANMEAGHYEVASTYLWHKTMALLKRKIATLGNEFIAELLQRPDIDDSSELQTSISDTEAVTLARELGMITATQALRLVHSQEVIAHFASVDADDRMDEAEGLTREEALSCLRVCVQGVLGQERVAVAEDFASFRRKLESETFTEASPEIVRLRQSPYFFVRTAISILLSILRGSKGAQIEHASRNTALIVPLFWNELKQPEKWQVGQAYASEFAEGRKESVKALHGVLLRVRGFDFVPENLRSNMFTKVANSVVAAHQGMNNFYNEPGPMRELASLGTSIPGPALAACITATLCVKLGNPYGVSWAAQASADLILAGISVDRWKYYIEGRLEYEPIILHKLAGGGEPLNRWIGLIGALGLEPTEFTNKSVRQLVLATNSNKADRVSSIALTMLNAAMASAGSA